MRSPIEPAHRGKAQRLVEMAERVGVMRALRHLHDRGSPVLTVLAYHRVVPADGLNNYSIDQELISATPAQFERQMRYLREHMHLTSMGEVIDHIEGRKPLPPAAVAVTFDDGFADTYWHAFPILKRHAIPATVFLTTGYVDSGEPFWFEVAAYLTYTVPPNALEVPTESRTFPSGDSRQERTRSLRQLHGILKDLPNPERVRLIEHWIGSFGNASPQDGSHRSRPLSWDQVREMAAAGVDFGSHTVTHPNLTKLTDQELRWELVESKKVLEERLQRAVDTLAYPIGTTSAFDARVINATERHGFKLGVTYVSGANPLAAISRFQIRRHGVGLGITLPYFRALTRLPSWIG